MAISKELVGDKVSYNVFVKVRDASGNQVSRRKRGIKSEREAKRIEFEMKSELQGSKSSVTWKIWSEHFL